MSGRARALRRAIPHAVVPVLVLPAYGFRTDPREIPSPLRARNIFKLGIRYQRNSKVDARVLLHAFLFERGLGSQKLRVPMPISIP